MPNFRDHVNRAVEWLTAPPGESKAEPTAPMGPLELKASDALRAAYFSRVGIEQYPPREYRALIAKYRTNPIVRRATKLCSEAVAAITPVIKVEGKEDDRVAQIIFRYLRRPNPSQARFEFVRDLAAFEKLSGNGWIEAARGAVGGYIEFYALRPERMRIIPGANGFPERYVYDPGTGAKKAWNADLESGQFSRLLHIRDFSADSDFYGAGALEAAEAALDVYESAETFARAMFKNGVTPSGALVWNPSVPAGQSPPQLTAEQRRDLQELLDKKFSGAKNAGKPMILGGGLTWQQFAMSLVDLQAEEIRNQAARQIANAFGVPPMLLGIPGDNTFANFQEASRAFYRNTVIPDTKRLFGALAAWLSKLTRIDNLEIDFDEDELWALADELTQRSARIEGSSVLSLEEKREALGWDRLPPAGDTLLMPAGLATLDDILNADLLQPPALPAPGDKPPPDEDR